MGITDPNATGAQGVADPFDTASEYNAQLFVIQSMLARLNHIELVQVVNVNDPGGISPTGTVDVTPVLNQLDAALNAVPHSVIYGLTYFRLQGGLNAVIITPQVGDIGVCMYADRDISAFKSSKKVPSNPGSLRTNDRADGIYFGGVLNPAPVRYLKIDDTGVTIEGVAAVTIHGNNTTVNCQTATVNASTSTTVNSPQTTVNASTQCKVVSPDIELQGNTTVTGALVVNGPTSLNGSLSQVSGVGGSGATMQGPLTVTNDVTAGGKSLETHTHGGVQPGSGNTGGPN